MSTKGLFGFRKDCNDKAQYNQFDSCPSGLGRDFVAFLKQNAEKVDIIYDKINIIDPKTNPTEEQKAYCKEMGWFNDQVSARSENDWYCLIYGLQDMKEWQHAVTDDRDILIENKISFIKDSLFCEYAYIYDLDTQSLEFYVGFQKSPDENNIYGQENKRGYFPCKMVHVIPLEILKNEPTDSIVEKFEVADELDYQKSKKNV